MGFLRLWGQVFALGETVQGRWLRGFALVILVGLGIGLDQPVGAVVWLGESWAVRRIPAGLALAAVLTLGWVLISFGIAREKYRGRTRLALVFDPRCQWCNGEDVDESTMDHHRRRWIRIGVANAGRVSIDSVRLYLDSLQGVNEASYVRPVEQSLPAPLRLSDNGLGSVTVHPSGSAHSRHFDLVYRLAISAEADIHFDGENFPEHLTNNYLRGVLRLEGENTEAIARAFVLRNDQERGLLFAWDDQPSVVGYLLRRRAEPAFLNEPPRI